MIYLSGVTSPSYEQRLTDLGVGLLIQPGSYAAPRVEPFGAWAADNACAAVVDGEVTRNPAWSCAKWARMLGAIRELSFGAQIKCLFALVPDWPLDHHRTVYEFMEYESIVRGFGLPIAFAIQDGADVETVPWDDFEVAFLAGSTEWKTGEQAYVMATEARRREKWIHMGRVNSWDRLDWASRIGCDSADGTFLKHGKPEEMVDRLANWLAKDAPRLTSLEAVVA